MGRWDITGIEKMKIIKSIPVKMLIIVVLAFLTTAFKCNISDSIDSCEMSNKRIVKLCTIEGYGSETEINCDNRGVFYESGEEEGYLGELHLIIDGKESDKVYPVYKNSRGGVRGDFKYRAGSKYYFN